MRAVLFALAIVVGSAVQARPFHNHTRAADEVKGFVALLLFGMLGTAVWLGFGVAKDSWRRWRGR